MRPFLEVLLGSGLRSKVLAWMLLHADAQVYVRQLAKLINEDSTNVSRELRRLEALDIVIGRTEGRQRYYQANRQCPVYPELRGLVAKTSGLAHVLAAALAPLRQKLKLAFVFGSLAAGRETAASDIDLMIVGEASFAEVADATHAVQGEIGREVNPSVYRLEDLRNKAHGDSHFVSAVLLGPKIFIIGNDDELERVVKPRLASPTPGGA